MEAAMEAGISGDGTGEMSLLEECEARRIAREARERGEDEDENEDENDDENTEEENEEEEDAKPTNFDLIPTLQPLPEDEVVGHATSFVNELRLSEFKVVLSRHNIASEFQGGVLFRCFSLRTTRTNVAFAC